MLQNDGTTSPAAEKFAAMAHDSQWRKANRVMRLNGHQPEALIEALHAVQDSFGYLDHDAMAYVAHELNVPLSRVFAVATFYHYFKLKPAGEHTCVICMGTACYISGASDIFADIRKRFGIAPGETTADGKISLLMARCLGSCGLAPAAVFDGQVSGRMTPTAVLAKIEDWTRHDPDA